MTNPSLTPPNLEIIHTPPPGGARLDRPPLLFVHGAFSGAWCWEAHFMGWFAAQGWDCWAFSFRGHGESDGFGDLHQHGIEDYVEDLDRMADRLPAPPIVIGHSMGGSVAMRWMGDNPGRARGLALMAAVPPSGLMGPALWLCVTRPFLLMHIGAMQAGLHEAGAEGALGLALFAADAPASLARRYLPLMSNESLRACLDLYLPWCVPLGLRELPCLVMGAGSDNLIPPASVRETAATLGVQAHILPGLGHGMMLDPEWATAARRLGGWLDNISLESVAA